MTMQWRNAPVVLLGAALLASAVLLLTLTSGTTFFQDTWAYLLDRQDFSADAFLVPHNEHIVLIPVAIEKLLVEVFGMGSAVPERVVMVLILLTTAVLVFAYVRRRTDPWLALFAAVLLLFLGAAWPILLWPFEIALAGSVMAGVGMLLALERDDRRGDVAACALLVVSIGFSSLGLCFVAAAAVDIFLRRRTRGLRRAYVAAVPLLLYAGWYVGWGHAAETHVTLDNILKSPVYVLDGFASSVDGLLGLTPFDVSNQVEPVWGRPILIGLIVLVIYGQIRKPGFSLRLWPVAAVAASYWLLAAFNFFPGREAVSSRYAYAGAVFVLLLAAELLRGVRISRGALWVGGVVTVAAVASNLVSLKMGADWFDEQAEFTRADLGAIEIARDTVDSGFTLVPEIAGTSSLPIVSAGKYFEAADAHGTPAYSPGELASAPEIARRQADIVLVHALPLSTEQLMRTGLPPAAECTRLAAGSGVSDVRLSPGVVRISVSPGPETAIRLRRFAVGEYPVQAEQTRGGTTTVLTIPRDTSTRPWRLEVDAVQRVGVCQEARGA